MTFNSVLVILGIACTALVVFHPKAIANHSWQATVTPLASIIGSGFLVLGPILMHDFGRGAPLIMGALCAVAYAFGSAIRFNILAYADEDDPPAIAHVERAASYALVVAYVVSITYYVNLFGAFAMRAFGMHSAVYAKLVSTAVIAFIAFFGGVLGLAGLEKAEEGAVGLKLAIIAGFLCSLAAFAVGASADVTAPITWSSDSLFVAFGLVITVQGFETSRYLGQAYDAPTRVRTMRFAQWTSTAIYVVYIGLITVAFAPSEVPNSETGIIDLTARISPILPFCMVIAALAAQFSAAVADTSGGGGLAAELTGGRVSPRAAYVGIGLCSVAITWAADIYAIISYASRAFALYYALQCAVAALFAYQRRRWRWVVCFVVLLALAGAITLLGRPAE